MSNQSHHLTIEEIERVAEQVKDELTLKGKQAARRHDTDSPFIAYGAVMAEDYIDKVVYALKVQARSGLEEYLSRPPRAKHIRINPHLLSKAK